jgi:hypothetical protein
MQVILNKFTNNKFGYEVKLLKTKLATVEKLGKIAPR